MSAPPPWDSVLPIPSSVDIFLFLTDGAGEITRRTTVLTAVATAALCLGLLHWLGSGDALTLLAFSLVLAAMAVGYEWGLTRAAPLWAFACLMLIGSDDPTRPEGHQGGPPA